MKPVKGYHRIISLNVRFRATKKYLETDKEVQKILGKRPTGSGISVLDKTRDLSFPFESETAAEAARKTLKKAGFQSFICVYEKDTL